MLPVLFGLAVAALVLASPFACRRLMASSFVSRRLLYIPARQAPGAAAVPPALHEDAGETAVPAIADREERQAFAYDNGLTVEEES